LNVTVGQGSVDTWWGGKGPTNYCGTPAASCGIRTRACSSWCTGTLMGILITNRFCAQQHICYSAYMWSQFCLAVWTSGRHTGGLYKNGWS